MKQEMAPSRSMSAAELRRKTNKPIMEKKRRQRINKCLEELKTIVVAATSEKSRPNKLEKADILELTVLYLRNLNTEPVQDRNCSRDIAAKELKPKAADDCLLHSSENPPSNINVIERPKVYFQCEQEDTILFEQTNGKFSTRKYDPSFEQPSTKCKCVLYKDSLRSWHTQSVTAHQPQHNIDSSQQCLSNSVQSNYGAQYSPSEFPITNQRDYNFTDIIIEKPDFEVKNQHKCSVVHPQQLSNLSRSISPVFTAHRHFDCSNCKLENTGGSTPGLAKDEANKLLPRSQSSSFPSLFRDNRQCSSNDSGHWSLGSRPSSPGDPWCNGGSLKLFNPSATCKSNGTSDQIVWRPWEV